MRRAWLIAAILICASTEQVDAQITSIPPIMTIPGYGTPVATSRGGGFFRRRQPRPISTGVIPNYNFQTQGVTNPAPGTYYVQPGQPCTVSGTVTSPPTVTIPGQATMTTPGVTVTTGEPMSVTPTGTTTQAPVGTVIPTVPSNSSTMAQRVISYFAPNARSSVNVVPAQAPTTSYIVPGSQVISPPVTTTVPQGTTLYFPQAR